MERCKVWSSQSCNATERCIAIACGSVGQRRRMSRGRCLIMRLRTKLPATPIQTFRRRGRNVSRNGMKGTTAMPYYFRAIAVDYDGTLTEGATPAPDVLAAVADIRAYGRKVILCTSRILSEWRADWPPVVDPFDAIVAENGSVIARAENPERATTTAVPAELAAALRKRRVPLRVGTGAPTPGTGAS